MDERRGLKAAVEHRVGAHPNIYVSMRRERIKRNIRILHRLDPAGAYIKTRKHRRIRVAIELDQAYRPEEWGMSDE
jgi:hypothetical protein